MWRSLPVTLIAAAAVSASCGYPSFQFGPGGTGGGPTTAQSSTGTGAGASTGSSSEATSSSGGTTATSSHSSSAATTGASSSGGITATTSSGGATCGIGHLVISEIRSRGPGGASDEFIELYNPKDTEAQLDSGWTIQGRSATSIGYSQRWSGVGNMIPAHGHYLIVGSSYTQSPAGDDTLSQSISDAASVVLQLDGAPVSVVCYYEDATTQFTLQNGGYTCDEMPVENPHDDTNDSNMDASIERKPGGAAGNCTNSGNNLVDFTISSPATPQNTQSPLTPD
jgi:hypothetical protein